MCALLAGGGCAEYVAVPAGQLLPIPNGVSLLDAAGLPEGGLHGVVEPGDDRKPAERPAAAC